LVFIMILLGKTRGGVSWFGRNVTLSTWVVSRLGF